MIASHPVGFEPVIGLEIHARLLTDTKIFCGCSTRFGHAPNTSVCPVCLGFPGALPVLNRRAVDFAAKAALALNCAVHEQSISARKNYFYPDLPKGYQISQYELPLATAGTLEFTAAGATKRVRITRVHMEEDAGKSLHEGFADSEQKTYLDFNRSGTPLIEIVTEPDLRSAGDAADAFRKLREMLIALGVNDGNMEEGSLRCDANVSLRPGCGHAGDKAEVKNINSSAIREGEEYEIARQAYVIGAAADRAGNAVVGSSARETFSMRTKKTRLTIAFSRIRFHRCVSRASARASRRGRVRPDGGVRAIRGGSHRAGDTNYGRCSGNAPLVGQAAPRSTGSGRNRASSQRLGDVASAGHHRGVAGGVYRLFERPHQRIVGE